MGLPKKALKESQLQYLTAGSAGPAPDSSHQICQVVFIEDGVQKKGFLKRLEPKNHYPELLAKMSVAASLLKRIFQGKNSAEERLVYADGPEGERLIGTLSIGIEGFKPFNFTSEAVPSDPVLKEQVIPSTKTLIEKNVMEALVARWLLDDDDTHPHNLGFANGATVDIDFDMFWYWFTIHMKEPRTIVGVPKKRISLSVPDWEHFPNVKDAKPYHWPTYERPGLETLLPGLPVLFLPKSYPEPMQFRLLAGDPIAQEQKFAAAMRVLLTYQPDMIRKRLTNLFGDMPLHYTSLNATDPNLRIKYETEFPLLCNASTDNETFVTFIMRLYQEHYDNLYRVVIFYMGCDDNGYGVSLQPAYSALYHKPSVYKETVKWVIGQNETLYSKDDSEAKFDLIDLQKRYHQIWRDAFAPSLKELLHKSFHLTTKLYKTSCVDQIASKIIDQNSTDENLTNAWQLFGIIPELSITCIRDAIVVDKDSTLREALLLLVDFTNRFNAIAKTYYEKGRVHLTEKDNLLFVRAINTLYETYVLDIRQNLAHTSSYADEFNCIAVSLKHFADKANFQLHLTTTDVQMKAVGTTTNITKEALPLTHEYVLKQFNESLFCWAKRVNPAEFTRIINEIIDSHYAPNLEFISKRHRSVPVKSYLKNSIHEDGDEKLAYILSSGNDTGALNTLLIQHLTPHMLQADPIPSICNALKTGEFDRNIAVFVASTVTRAKNDPRFIHLYTSVGIELFCTTLFDWVEHLSKDKFDKLLNTVLADYEKGLWGLWRSSRRQEVTDYVNSFSNQAKVLAMIFLKGSGGSTLNKTLFQKTVDSMKKEFSCCQNWGETPAYRLVMQYNEEEHPHIFAIELKKYAEAASHKQEEPELAKR